MRALNTLFKKNPGHGSRRAGAIRKYIGNVINIKFVSPLQA
jgi:hypothetical protein